MTRPRQYKDARMRHSIRVFLCVTGAFALSACAQSPGDEVDRALRDINVIDESNLNDVMMQSSDPAEAVAVWDKVVAHPDAADADRVALAGALIRNNDWTRAGEVLDAIPPTFET